MTAQQSNLPHLTFASRTLSGIPLTSEGGFRKIPKLYEQQQTCAYQRAPGFRDMRRCRHDVNADLRDSLWGLCKFLKSLISDVV
jgi:hypothetical protein